MADLKLNGVTPNKDQIKLGFVDVLEIKYRNQKVWPPAILPPGQVGICNLIWTNENSSIRDTTSGGIIPIATDATEFYTQHNAGLPVAAYWQFDSNNSERGLLYNQFAARLIQPPTGFRLPTTTDFTTIFGSACNSSDPNQNRYGTSPGNWASTLTDTTELGNTNLNLNGYGYAVLNSNAVFFIGDTLQQRAWTSSINPNNGVNTSKGITTNAISPYLTTTTDTVNGATMANYIRFVKDA